MMRRTRIVTLVAGLVVGLCAQAVAEGDSRTGWSYWLLAGRLGDGPIDALPVGPTTLHSYHRVRGNAYATEQSFSADGEVIAAVRRTGKTNALVFSPLSGPDRVLVRGTETMGAPAVARDGGLIAVTRYRHAKCRYVRSEIVTFEPESERLERFRLPRVGRRAQPFLSGGDSVAAVSPDRRRVVLSRSWVLSDECSGGDSDDRTGIGLVVDLATGELRKIAGDAIASARWSPDGRWLAFATGEWATGWCSLYIARADGSQSRTVATAGQFGCKAHDLEWTAGNRLLFATERDLFEVNPRTRRRRWLVQMASELSASCASYETCPPHIHPADATSRRFLLEGGAPDAEGRWMLFDPAPKELRPISLPVAPHNARLLAVRLH